MAHKFNQGGKPFIVLDDDGYMMIYSKDGHEVGANIFLRVHDHVEDSPYAIGKFAVNIVATKEEMFSEIERYKKLGEELRKRLDNINNK